MTRFKTVTKDASYLAERAVFESVDDVGIDDDSLDDESMSRFTRMAFTTNGGGFSAKPGGHGPDSDEFSAGFS